MISEVSDHYSCKVVKMQIFEFDETVYRGDETEIEEVRSKIYNLCRIEQSFYGCAGAISVLKGICIVTISPLSGALQRLNC